ncbi:MAG: diadenylate cyclase CdaA [Anaerolineales bacterium]|nr:diadenylate cyclase CdaA [Anaerolineales bacterium]
MDNLPRELLFNLERINFSNIFDLILVVAIFYFILQLLQGTRGDTLIRGMILMIIAISIFSSLLPLPAFSWLLRNTLPALLIAIPVIFAPEIRRGLERLGRAGSNIIQRPDNRASEQIIPGIVTAAQRLSNNRHGALIVIERTVHLDEYIETGIPMDAILTPELLLQIFYVNTPLHDGAVIIRENLIAAASCVMPLSASGTFSRSLDRQMGLRHRAALGISEVSDAISVVVSEETGAISVTHNGRMIRRLDPNRLRNILIAFYRPRSETILPPWLYNILNRIFKNRFSSHQV